MDMDDEYEEIANVLVGRRILSVRISEDRERIEFNTDAGLVCADCYADCCSASWVEEFDYNNIIGGVVTLVNTKYLNHGTTIPSVYPDKQQDEDEQHFYEISTDKGAATIEMRNSSNGYYGGGLDFYVPGYGDA